MIPSVGQRTEEIGAAVYESGSISIQRQPLPNVSVVMAVRDEAAHIDSTLASIAAQDYDGSIELIIADGMSRDDTRAIIERHQARSEGITVLENPDRHVAPGLNIAIAAATGEVLVRCDGHAELPPEYVRLAVQILSESGAVNVGGVQAAEGVSFLERAVAIAMTSPLGVGNSRFHYASTPGPTDTVYLGSFRKAAVDELGGFDERLVRNQDYELNHRLRKAGGLVWFDARLRVIYRPRSSFIALARQYFDYGLWKREMLRMSPGALKARQLAPPALVIGLLASTGLALAGSALSLPIPGAYAAFVGLGAVFEAFRRRDAAAALLPLVLPVMHLSWGVGFLAGRARR